MAELADLCRFWPVAAGLSDWQCNYAVQGFLDDLGCDLIDGAEYHVRSEGPKLLQWEVSTGAYDAATRTIARTVIEYSSDGGNKVHFDVIPQCGIVTLAQDVGPRIISGFGVPTMVVRDGTAYINDSNQDFWLRETGVWVRKGNIRDEGSQGIVGIQPIIGTGLNMSATVDRIRYTGTIAAALGIDMTALVDRSRYLVASGDMGAVLNVVLDRIREVPANLTAGFDMNVVVSIIATEIIYLTASMDVGLSQTSIVDRIRALSAAMDSGLTMNSTVERTRQLIVAQDVGLSMDSTLTVGQITDFITAAMSEGFDMTAAISLVKAIAVSMGEGFNMAAAVSRIKPIAAAMDTGLTMVAAVARIKAISAAMAEGLTMGAAVTKIKPIAAAMAEGVTMAAAVQRIKLLGSVAMAEGLTMAAVVAHSVPQSGFMFVGGKDGSNNSWLITYTGLYATTTNPASLPTGGIQCIAVNYNKTRVAIAGLTDIKIYDCSTSAFSLVSTITGALGGSFNTCSMAFNPAGTLLCVVDRSLSTTTMYTVSTGVSTTKPAVVNAALVDWSQDGARIVFGRASSGPYIAEYNASGYALLSNGLTQPSQQPRSLKYSPDNKYLCAIGSSMMEVYDRNNNMASLSHAATWPDSGPTPVLGSNMGIAWSSAGTKLIVANNTSPYLWEYSIASGVITKDTNPSGAGTPTGSIGGVFAESGTKFIAQDAQSGSAPALAKYDVPSLKIDASQLSTQPSSTINTIAATY
jgi:hypothetical protein